LPKQGYEQKGKEAHRGMKNLNFIKLKREENLGSISDKAVG
jgi:hypothetical protein